MCNDSFHRGINGVDYCLCILILMCNGSFCVDYCLPIFGMCNGSLPIFNVYNGPFMEELITALPHLVCVMVRLRCFAISGIHNSGRVNVWSRVATFLH